MVHPHHFRIAFRLGGYTLVPIHMEQDDGLWKEAASLSKLFRFFMDDGDELLCTTTNPALTAILKGVPAPAMPAGGKGREHRYRCVPSPFTHVPASVSRPVPKNDIKGTDGAMAVLEERNHSWLAGAHS